MNGNDSSRISLGFFPTPLIRLSRLSETLGGATVYMKRDDQSGLALGGNKTRKLEFILGDAVAQGCDAIITAGAEQSNHCRQTAAAAAKLNLECHLLLGGEQPQTVNGNLLIDRLMGARIHWTGENRKGETIPELYRQLTAAGKKPCVVPYGGSNELGALGFVEATRELLTQSSAQPFSHIVFASSSGGTQAGLMVGKAMFDQHYQLVGIRIDKDESATEPFQQQIVALANRTATLLQFERQFSMNDLVLQEGYLGKGYGVVCEAEREAISLTATTEGILLDPVYTGRAMAGLIGMIRSGEIGESDRVLFWHTGGAPALFAYADSLVSAR